MMCNIFFDVCLLSVYLLFVYFWLCCILIVVQGLSLVKVSGGYSSVALRGLLIVVVFLVVEHGLSSCVWAVALKHVESSQTRV